MPAEQYHACFKQAWADAVRAAAICHLPLRPLSEAQRAQPAPADTSLRALFKYPADALQCALPEIDAKSEIYHVYPFTLDETRAIVAQARPKADLGAQKGQSRLGPKR
jgi:hypothetical protein